MAASEAGMIALLRLMAAIWDRGPMLLNRPMFSKEAGFLGEISKVLHVV